VATRVAMTTLTGRDAPFVFNGLRGHVGSLGATRILDAVQRVIFDADSETAWQFSVRRRRRAGKRSHMATKAACVAPIPGATPLRDRAVQPAALG
jgi:hypothetical protein